jgi:hypothetical protein
MLQRAAAGFSRQSRAGIYSIEFEGEGDPHAGVQHVVDELR